MSEPTEKLKSVLQDLIHDRQEQASVTIHDYIVAKTQEITGLGSSASNDIDLSDIDELDSDQVTETSDQE